MSNYEPLDEWQPSRREKAVLLALYAAGAGQPVSHYALRRTVPVRGSTIYRVLWRLEQWGWARREQETPEPPGRPPRTFYQLTEAGWVRIPCLTEMVGWRARR